MTCIVTGIVDEHANGAQVVLDAAQMVLIGVGVANITGTETRPMLASRRQPLDQRFAGRAIDIAERNVCTLLGKMFDQRGTNTGAAARHEHNTICKAWVTRHIDPFSRGRRHQNSIFKIAIVRASSGISIPTTALNGALHKLRADTGTYFNQGRTAQRDPEHRHRTQKFRLHACRWPVRVRSHPRVRW